MLKMKGDAIEEDDKDMSEKPKNYGRQVDLKALWKVGRTVRCEYFPLTTSWQFDLVGSLAHIPNARTDWHFELGRGRADPRWSESFVEFRRQGELHFDIANEDILI